MTKIFHWWKQIKAVTLSCVWPTCMALGVTFLLAQVWTLSLRLNLLKLVLQWGKFILIILIPTPHLMSGWPLEKDQQLHEPQPRDLLLMSELIMKSLDDHLHPNSPVMTCPSDICIRFRIYIRKEVLYSSHEESWVAFVFWEWRV